MVDIREIREALDDEDVEVRRQAATALSSPDLFDRDLLIKALGDSDWRVRAEAVESARAATRDATLATELVLAVAQGDNVGLRNSAIDVLKSMGEQAFDAVKRGYEEGPSEARKFFVEILVATGGPRAVSLILSALSDPDPNLRNAAIGALAPLGEARITEALVERLSSETSFSRLSALDALLERGAPLSPSMLAPLVVDPITRRHALLALGHSGSVEAIPAVRRYLDDSAFSRREAAILAMGELFRESSDFAGAVRSHLEPLDEPTREGLREVLKKGATPARTEAAHLLLVARDIASLREILELASDDVLSDQMRESLTSLGRIVVPTLLSLFRDTTGATRALSLELASDLAALPGADEQPDQAAIGTEVRAQLRIALLDGDIAVARSAARGLIVWAEAFDAAILVELAQRDDEELSLAAVDGLRSLATRSPEAVDAALDHVRFDEAGAVLAKVAARLGGERAIARLTEALSSTHLENRALAIEALSELGTEKAADLIALGLADEHRAVQVAAADALRRMAGRLPHETIAEKLAAALHASAEEVRVAAARALAEIGDQRGLTELRMHTHSIVPVVALSAVEALRSVRDPAIDEHLVDALAHKDEEVVKQALRALADSKAERSVERIAVGLTHRAWDVRTVAAELLGAIGGAAATVALTERLANEEDDLVRRAIEDAIRRIDGRTTESGA